MSKEMIKLLTPQETLQALIEGKDVEYRFYDEVATDNEWEYFYMGSSPVSWLLDEDHQFRLAQEMVKIGNVSFPKPYQGEMLYKQEYYYPIMDYTSLFGSNTWECDRADLFVMKKGLVHLTKENAIAHAKALIRLSGGNYE